MDIHILDEDKLIIVESIIIFVSYCIDEFIVNEKKTNKIYRLFSD